MKEDINFNYTGDVNNWLYKTIKEAYIKLCDENLEFNIRSIYYGNNTINSIYLNDITNKKYLSELTIYDCPFRVYNIELRSRDFDTYPIIIDNDFEILYKYLKIWWCKNERRF